MQELASLHHVIIPLQNGGKILALNTGAVITPEAEAMLQALHSRSIAGIDGHLKVLAEKGPEKFMSTYYVGYGHKSIGDCGSATLFIEGVSMLAAKAVQDWRLYSGQEASTRYIDFATQPFIDPVGTDASKKILEAWRTFYLRGLELLVPDLRARFPRAEEEKEGVYEKAIKARAFDILRGFLPAGATTNLAWHGNLRQFADKLLLMRHHPLQEVQEIAIACEQALLRTFPNSFSEKRYEATEAYNRERMEEYYFDPDGCPEFAFTFDGIDRSILNEHRSAWSLRPPKTEPPKWLGESGVVQFNFLLDFGSFRDLQRHRAIAQRMPLLSLRHGFEPWYLEELTPQLANEGRQLLQTQEVAIGQLDVSKEMAQYYIAMGYRVPNRVVGDLPALVYLSELRGTPLVHATIRKRAIQIGHALYDRYHKEGLVMHFNADPDRFDVTRGEHDIVRVN